MYCVKYFPWLKESAEGISLSSSSTVALRVRHPIALVINQTTFHSQLERNDCHANMCLMLCLDVRETEFPICTVKTTVLKKSWMNGFLRQKGEYVTFFLLNEQGGQNMCHSGNSKCKKQLCKLTS